MNDSTRKILLITGVSSGFGRAFAKAALAEGHGVIGTVRTEDARKEFEALAPGRATGILLDVADFAAIEPAVSEVEKRVGPIDVLVNNAGFGHEGVLEESSIEDLRRQFDVNVFGAVAMIKAVLDALKSDQPKLAPLRVWRAYALLDEFKGSDPRSELTVLVSLIRRACGIDPKLAPYADTVRRNFQTWILKRHSGAGEKFTGEQLEWLHMIRDHIMTSIHLDREDLDFAPFNAKGGLSKMYLLFGESMDSVIEELNEALAA